MCTHTQTIVMAACMGLGEPTSLWGAGPWWKGMFTSRHTLLPHRSLLASSTSWDLLLSEEIKYLPAEICPMCELQSIVTCFIHFVTLVLTSAAHKLCLQLWGKLLTSGRDQHTCWVFVAYQQDLRTPAEICLGRTKITASWVFTCLRDGWNFSFWV